MQFRIRFSVSEKKNLLPAIMYPPKIYKKISEVKTSG